MPNSHLKQDKNNIFFNISDVKVIFFVKKITAQLY